MIQVSMGLIGVGTMGGALALNIAENGTDVALWNLDLLDIDALIASAGPLAQKLKKSDSVKAMVQAMPQPRAIILLVPAGTPVDHTIDNLIPLLSSGVTPSLMVVTQISVILLHGPKGSKPPDLRI